MRVLVACEFSGTVRNAFARMGHDAWSCDLLPSETPGNHIIADVLDILPGLRGERWDLMVGHPLCTHLCVSGARWFSEKAAEQADALAFFCTLLDAPIPRICLENPVGIVSTRIMKPSQVIQPWQFGHAENKRTCLWLKGLPKLRPTRIMTGDKINRIHEMGPGPDRWKERSRTFQGIADAMAKQWTNAEFQHTLSL